MPVIPERLGEENILDTTTLDSELFRSISLFIKMFTTLTEPFMRGNDDLPLNQHNKYKRL